MAKFIVYQSHPSEGVEGVEQLGPQVVMAGLTEADNASDAVHSLIDAGTFQGGTLNAVDVSSVESFDVSVKATLKAVKNK